MAKLSDVIILVIVNGSTVKSEKQFLENTILENATVRMHTIPRKNPTMNYQQEYSF